MGEKEKEDEQRKGGRPTEPTHVPVAVYKILRYFPIISTASSSLPRLPPTSMLSDKAASSAVGCVTEEASDEERARALAIASISGELMLLCPRMFEKGNGCVRRGLRQACCKGLEGASLGG